MARNFGPLYDSQYFEILGFYVLYNFSLVYHTSHFNDSIQITINLLLALEYQFYVSQYFEILGLCILLNFSPN